MRSLAEVFPVRRGGYWGKEAGTGDVDAKAIRNGDVGTSGELRWGALPWRAYTSQEFAKAQVHAGDVVLTTSGNCGNVAYIATEPETPTVATNFVRILRANPATTDSRYAFHFLRTAAFSRGIAPFVRGATIKNLSVEAALDTVQMPLPPLPEQRRIAAILDHADAIRAKRRRVITHLSNSLAQATFVNMFGDAGHQPMLLSEVADFYGGSSLPTGEEFAGQPGGTLLMKVSDMNADGNEEEVRATALWTASPTPRSSTVKAGAVVLPKRGASIATNKKRLTTRPTALDPNVMGVQPRTELVDSRYMHEWFKSFDLATITSGSTVPQLNKQDLVPLMIPIPPLNLQP